MKLYNFYLDKLTDKNHKFIYIKLLEKLDRVEYFKHSKRFVGGEYFENRLYELLFEFLSTNINGDWVLLNNELLIYRRYDTYGICCVENKFENYDLEYFRKNYYFVEIDIRKEKLKMLENV